MRGSAAAWLDCPQPRDEEWITSSAVASSVSVNQRLRRKSKRMLMSGSRPRYGRTAWTGKQTVYGSAASAAGLQRRYIQYNDGWKKS